MNILEHVIILSKRYLVKQNNINSKAKAFPFVESIIRYSGLCKKTLANMSIHRLTGALSAVIYLEGKVHIKKQKLNF